MAEIHVAPSGADSNSGGAEAPLRTISRAAALATPGDTVLVRGGVYREWVKPARGGLSDSRRITYQAAPGERPVIKGSDVVAEWEPDAAAGVWRAEVPNSLFGGFNPYAETVSGDWVLPHTGGGTPHLGEVYLNGRALREVFTRADLVAPSRHEFGRDYWTTALQPTPDPDWSTRVWLAEVGPETTTIWANFQGANPTEELVEINVRRSVFYPELTHLDWITVRGFELAHAATPWAPPTADQPGLIGPNWAKGWIIADNLIHDAKCAAVSLGKEISTGHNLATQRGDKPGYQYQIETVFRAREQGWDKDYIGSHVVRRNEIHSCGQNGIVGNLGCIFSTIADNHIHDIGNKWQFQGYEVAGIKLHAPIDTQITHNRIHDTTLGIWLDWQAQGTRVNRNLLYRNTRDLFIEVSHGPCLIDHNVFASREAIELFSQGNAVVNNLIAGSVRALPALDRATPYHVPHSTKVAGYAFVHGGDDRFVGNLFIGADALGADGEPAPPLTGSRIRPAKHGTMVYHDYPASFDEYLAEVNRDGGAGDHDKFHKVRQPAYISRNAYAAGAEPSRREAEPLVVPGPARFAVVERGVGVYLEFGLPREVAAPVGPTVTAADLPRVRLVDADFESPDGTPSVIDQDMLGQRKAAGANYPAGPFATLDPDDVQHRGAGVNARIQVW